MSRFIYLFPAFLLLFLASCGDESVKTESEKPAKKKSEISDPELKGMMDELNTETTTTLEDGYHELKYPDGKLKSVGTIANGQKEGLWTHYREDGNKWSECNFTNDKPNGKVVSYHPNGQVNYIGYFTNGVKTGEWQFYNTDGELIKEVKMTK